MNSIVNILTDWLLPGVATQFTSCRRHAMDELMFGSSTGSTRFAREKLQSLIPEYAYSLIADEEALSNASGAPDLPTPTDVPVPEPHDIPVPEPIDVPPPTPRDVPPPKPDEPEVDPRPRPIP